MRKRVSFASILSHKEAGGTLACAVCFGKFDNPNVPWAYLLGGIILIGFTFLLLGGLVAAICRIEMHRSVGGRK